MRKSIENDVVLAKDADLYCVYRCVVHTGRKVYNKFVIPIKNDKNDSLRCKLVTLVNDTENASFKVSQITYEANYRLESVDVSTDKLWLLVKELEKQRKEQKMQEENLQQQQQNETEEKEKPAKRKRGRPKKAR